VETVINEEGMNIEVFSIDSLIDSTEKLRYAAATPDGWIRFGSGEYKNGE